MMEETDEEQRLYMIGARRRRRRRLYISTPVNFAAVATSSNEVNLNWGASTGYAVDGYTILRNGTEIADIPVVFAGTYGDYELEGDTSYTYEIFGYNRFGGESSRAITTVTTPPAFHTAHFDGVTGNVSVLEDITFSPTAIESNAVSTYPGHVALRAHSGRVNVGVIAILNSNSLSRASQFRQLSLDIASGNFDNLKIDVTGYDSNLNVIGVQTEIINASTARTLNLNTLTNATTITFTRNPTSQEVRHAQAVGIVIIIGGRPRPPIYNKGIALTNIRYSIG